MTQQMDHDGVAMADRGNDRTYAMLVKPVSSSCNLRCEYCYYLGKNELLHTEEKRMPYDVLKAFTKQMFAMHGRDAAVEFAWHGGEPLLAGLSFYREAVLLQQKFGAGRNVRNNLQTNGTLLTEEYCSFFREHHFDLGVSIDGPEKLHNAFRRDAAGGGSFARTMQGVRLLRQYGVPFSALTTVNRQNMNYPLEVYHFLREWTDMIQFLPVVEGDPAHPGQAESRHSVTPEGYGAFLTEIWKEWIREDPSTRPHIQQFDVLLDCLKGRPASLCTLAPVCGHSGSVEADGDVYSCDRFAFPEFRLGNLMEEPLGSLMEKNRGFGMRKTYGLPEECLDCRYVWLCFGGCPKDRGADGKNYLCAGFRMFYDRAVQDTGFMKTGRAVQDV